MISRYLAVWLLVSILWPLAAAAQQPQDYDEQPPAPPGTLGRAPLAPATKPEAPAPAPVRPPGSLPVRSNADPGAATPPSASEPHVRPTTDAWTGAPSGAQNDPSDTQVPAVSPFPPAPPPHTPPGEVDATSSLVTEPVPDTVQSTPLPPDAAPSQPEAAAQPPASVEPARSIQASVMLGLGATFDHTLGGVNPLGFGFGVRGAYRLLEQLVVGGRVLYFVGGSSELPNGEISMQSWLIAAEAAYPLELDGVEFQFGLALGVMVRDIDGRPGFIGETGAGFVPGSQDQTQAGLYFAPGANVLFPLSIVSRELEMLFLGGDTRFDLVFGSGVSANVQLLLQGGIRF
jgi:hypothetical protein